MNTALVNSLVRKIRAESKRTRTLLSGNLRRQRRLLRRLAS